MTSKKKISPDNYKLGYQFLLTQQYEKADSIYELIIKEYRDNYLSYNALALSKLYQDPEGIQGLAKEPYEKVISILESDSTLLSEKPKPKNLVTAYQYIATYFTQREDLKNASVFWDKVEMVEPTHPGPNAFREYIKKIKK